MSLLESILGGQSSGAVGQLAAQFGLKPEQAASAVGALLPAVTGGIKRNTTSDAGVNDLAAALGKGRHEQYVNDPGTLAQPETTADGNAILGHLLGSKDASRAVAAHASAQTGIDPAILKKMLPLVAALAMGGLARRSRTGGAAGTAGGLGSMLGNLLDRDHDGSPLDDLGGLLGGMFGGKRP